VAEPGLDPGFASDVMADGDTEPGAAWPPEGEPPPGTGTGDEEWADGGGAPDVPAAPMYDDAVAEAEDWEAWDPSPEEIPEDRAAAIAELPTEEIPAPEPGEWPDQMYSGAVTQEHRGLAEAISRADTEEAAQLQALAAPMAGVESGVVGFEDVEDLGTDEEYIAPAASDLGLRVLTGLVLVSLLLGALWVGGEALAGFIALLMLVGLVEFYTTLRHAHYRPLALFGYLGAMGLLALAWFEGPIAIVGGLVATTVVVYFVYALAPERRDALTNGGLTVLGVAWIAGAAAFAFPIVDSPDYRVLVFAIVVCTVAMDVGAYAFGKSFGSKPLAPVLSPNKTVEGLAGGVIITIGAALAIGYFLEPFDVRSGAALGLVVAFTAPFGDLAESMIKRSLSVKDMGTLLPGHGGILDRVDGFLFVLPAAWVLYRTLGLLG
jgi:phosphatidate cytidylyltransferase